MKRVLIAIVILLTVHSRAWATWSVIAVDKKTGQVIVASAPGHGRAYLRVTDEDIKPNENANPVKTLRTRYEAWKKAGSKPFSTVPTVASSDARC
jgi:hypothetical protein